MHACCPSELMFLLTMFVVFAATPSDFVSFKLDVDNSDTEMPIALSLLSDPAFAQLVDEFFFELHFQCDQPTTQPLRFLFIH